MSDSDDPFTRKKRSSKPTKRRRRPAGRLFDDESDTDDDREGPPFARSAVRAKTVKNPNKLNPRVSFAFPKDLYKEKGHSDEDKDADGDDEPRPDYSAAGLQRLRDLTFKEPPRAIKPVVEQPPPFPRPPPPPKVSKEVIDVDYESMDIMAPPSSALRPARSAERAAENRANTQRADDGGVGFISLDRERTDENLGVIGSDDLEAMELDVPGNDDRSGAEEWEREQLRRAGLDLGDANVTNHEARGIVEQEDLENPIGGGEIGHSAVDAFFEGIEEANHATKYKMERCAKKLEEVRKSRVEIEGEPFVIGAVHLPEPPPPPPAPLSHLPPPPPPLPFSRPLTPGLVPPYDQGLLEEYEHFLPSRD